MPVNTTIPGQTTPFVKDKPDDRQIDNVWYRFLVTLFQRGNPFPAQTIFPLGPGFFTAETNGSVIISGGTPFDTVKISRDGGMTFYDTGQSAGIFPMMRADVMLMSFSVPPTTRVFLPGS